MNNKKSTNGDTQMRTVHSAHNKLGMLFCIIYRIRNEPSFASWEFLNALQIKCATES